MLRILNYTTLNNIDYVKKDPRQALAKKKKTISNKTSLFSFIQFIKTNSKPKLDPKNKPTG